MSKYLHFLLAAGIVSCVSPSQEQQVVSDFIQNFNGTHVDLSLKIEKFQKSEDVRVSDSVEILKSQVGIDIDTAHVYAESTIKSYHDLIKMGANYEKYRDSYEESRDVLNLITIIRRYESMDPDSVLARKYDVTYSIKNPILKTDQTIRKIFYLSSDGTRVIRDEKIEL